MSLFDSLIHSRLHSLSLFNSLSLSDDFLGFPFFVRDLLFEWFSESFRVFSTGEITSRGYLFGGLAKSNARSNLFVGSAKLEAISLGSCEDL